MEVSGLEEDLLALSKTIAELRRKADEEEAAERNTSQPVVSGRSRASQPKQQSAKPLTDDDWWTKKIFGATALAGCALLWGVGSYLEAPPQ